MAFQFLDSQKSKAIDFGSEAGALENFAGQNNVMKQQAIQAYQSNASNLAASALEFRTQNMSNYFGQEQSSEAEKTSNEEGIAFNAELALGHPILSTIKGVYTGLKDAYSNGQEALTSLKSGVNTAIEAVKGAPAAAKEALSNAGDAVQNFAGTTRSALSDLTGNVQAGLANVQTVAGQALEDARTTATGLADTTGANLTNALATTKAAGQAALGETTEAAQTAMSGTRAAAQSALGETSAGAQEASAGVRGALTESADAVPGMLSSIGSRFTNMFSAGASRFNAGAQSNLSNFQSLDNDGYSAISDSLTSGGGNMLSAPTFAELSSRMQVPTGSVESILPSQLGDLPGGSVALPSVDVAGMAGGASEAASGVLGGASAAGANVLSGAEGAARGVMGSAQAGAEALGSQATQAGQALADTATASLNSATTAANSIMADAATTGGNLLKSGSALLGEGGLEEGLAAASAIPGIGEIAGAVAAGFGVYEGLKDLFSPNGAGNPVMPSNPISSIMPNMASFAPVLAQSANINQSFQSGV